MSVNTTSDARTDDNQTHDSDLDYESIADFSVPPAVAIQTGIDDLEEFDGFEHRGLYVTLEDLVEGAQQALYFEHSHAGETAAPQSTISLHAAADRLATYLGKRLSPWMSSNPDIEGPIAGEAVDEAEIWGQLWRDDPLGLRDDGIAYRTDVHQQLVVSALAILFAEVEPQQQADEELEAHLATRAVRDALLEDAHGTLSREAVHDLVDEWYDTADELRE